MKRTDLKRPQSQPKGQPVLGVLNEEEIKKPTVQDKAKKG